MKYPNIRTIDSVKDDFNITAEIDGECVVVRPQTTIFNIKNRIKATWLVFTGQADALCYHKQ